MDDLTRLLLSAGDGDEDALSAFVEATQADVWRFCAYLVDRGSADDLTQDVYARALRTLGAFRGDASARTWLLAVARNVCADEIRRRRRTRERGLAGRGTPAAGRGAWETGRGTWAAGRGASPAAEVTPDPAGAVELAEIIGQLDDDRRAAFVLTQVLGWSYADAAAACDVPVGTIRSRVARARSQLMASLAPPAAGSG